MSSEETPNVLLFGVGSVGAVYLYLLSKICSTTVICRSNYEIVKEQGFVINSTIFGQGLTVKPNVFRNCEEASQAQSPNRPFDYLLVCSKAIPNTIPEIIKPAVTSNHTVIVLVQNGINIESEYLQAFPTNPIVSVAVYCKATQRPAGVITHDEVEKLQIGAYPSTASPRPAQHFTTLMKACGATADFYSNIQEPRWYKLLINASWNLICALTLSTDIEFLESGQDATDLVWGVILEVCAVAKACGVIITEAQAEAQLARTKARMGKGKAAEVEPSMLQDVRWGRRLEVEAIAGNTVRAAREVDVSCPKLEVLYTLVKALDAKIGKSGWPN